MSWYKTGTVSVTNGSPTVTGVGTNFIEGANAGEALKLEDTIYEIASIESATSLTLSSNYLGSTQTGEDYSIVPTQGLVANLTTQVKDLITDFTNTKDGIISTVKLGDGTVSSPSLTFNNDQNNGLYKIGSDNWGMVAGGTKVIDVSASGAEFTGTATFDDIDVDGTATMDGLVVDNITIDGNEIDVSSGDLTIDVAGDIILDADGSTISMKDDGTTRYTFNLDNTPDLVMAGGNASITASTQDADLLFIGNDGGSDITALTLDMSNAGYATLNDGLTVNGTATMDGLVVDGNVGIINGTDISMNAGAAGQFNITGNAYGFGIALDATGAHLYTNSASRPLIFGVNETARMRIDGSGNLLVGTTLGDVGYWYNRKGVVAKENGQLHAAVYGGAAAVLNRNTNDGDIVQFRKAGSLVGTIGSEGGDALYIQSGTTSGAGLLFHPTQGNINPARNNAKIDNAIDLGRSTHRFKDIYATNGTIQTSDAREKTEVREFTDSEMRVAKKLSKNIGFFQWLASVEEKGDDARLHCGQTVQSVIAEFEAEGLDAFDYAMICYNEWDAETVEHPAVEAVEAVDAVYDEEGELISEAIEAVEAADAWTETTQEAGDRYSLRTDQLNHFMVKGLAQAQEELEARISALEA